MLFPSLINVIIVSILGGKVKAPFIQKPYHFTLAKYRFRTRADESLGEDALKDRSQKEGVRKRGMALDSSLSTEMRH